MRYSSLLSRFPRSLLLLLGLLAVSRTAAQGMPEGFLASPTAPAPSVYAALTSSPTRTVIALNGTWQLSRDEGESWAPVTIPSSFNDIGGLRFQRTFQIPEGLVDRYRWQIVCYGVQYQSSVAINGQFVSMHESGTPFTLTVPDGIKLAARNTITIDVANELDYTSTVPLRKLLLGSRTYGGIVRDIFLVGVPRVWVEDVRVDTKLAEGSATLRLDAAVIAGAIRGMKAGGSGDSVSGSTVPADRAEFELEVSLARRAAPGDSGSTGEVASGKQTFSIESKRSTSVALSINVPSPALWAPGSPQLYDATVRIRYGGALVDERVVAVGFRSVTATRTGIAVNGTAVPLHGVAYVEDSRINGMSLSYEQMRRDMTTMRDMGVTVVRFVDGAPHPYLLQLCDELGLLAFIDVPIGTPPTSMFGSESFLKRVLDRARFTVDVAHIHPSVAAYGISAIIPGTSSNAVAAVTHIRSTFDSLDRRLFYCVATDWSDPALRKAVDVAGVVAFDLDLDHTRGVLVRAQTELRGERPLALLGYGKLVQLKNHNGYTDPIAIEAQAKYISDVVSVLGELKVAGGVYWTFADYRTDRPIMTANNEDENLASCGLYTLDRELRQGASMLLALYTDQKPPDVFPGDYNPPSAVVFIATGIGCAVAFLLLINSSRRFRENVFRALLRPFNFFADVRDQRILSTVHTALLAVVIAVTFALIVTSICYHYRMDEAFDTTLSAIITSDSIKGMLNRLIWQPGLGIVALTVFFMLLLLLVAAIIRACAVFVRGRIVFGDALVISVWSALPVLVLIVPAMILDRALEATGVSVITFSVMVAVLLWTLYRILRGVAVVYDVRPAKAYGYALGTIIALLLVIYVSSGEFNARLGYLSDGVQMLFASTR